MSVYVCGGAEQVGWTLVQWAEAKALGTPTPPAGILSHSLPSFGECRPGSQARDFSPTSSPVCGVRGFTQSCQVRVTVCVSLGPLETRGGQRAGQHHALPQLLCPVPRVCPTDAGGASVTFAGRARVEGEDEQKHPTVCAPGSGDQGNNWMWCFQNHSGHLLKEEGTKFRRGFTRVGGGISARSQRRKEEEKGKTRGLRNEEV